MESKLNEELTEAVRRWATPTTPDELKARGVARVRSVSLSRVASLLEKAVNRTLMRRTLESQRDDARAEEALSLSNAAREEFLALAQGQASDDHLKERAASTLDRLKRELDERRAAIEDQERAHTDGELDDREDSALADRLRELFATFGGENDVPARLEHAVVDMVTGEVRSARSRVRRARLEEHRRELSLLERRIAKLSALVGEREDALRRIQAAKAIDQGLSSIYEVVQGLTEDDQYFEKKKELMQVIFESNLEMRST